LCFPDKKEADQDTLQGLTNKALRVGDVKHRPQGQIDSQEVFQKFVGSNSSCIERRQGQKTGTVFPTGNRMDALSLDKEVCGTHEYYYEIVVLVLGATAAAGAVHCHQRTGRASWPNEVDQNTPKYHKDCYFLGWRTLDR
jgi:hypothetical protein